MIALGRSLEIPFPDHDSRAEISDDNILSVTCVKCGGRFSRRLAGDAERNDVVLVYANGGHHPGGLVQDMFPSWSESEREMLLMTHVCSECWNAMFPQEDAE